MKHPPLQLDLQLTDRYVDLIGERFDAAIRIGAHLLDSSLHACALGRVPRVLVAAPAYLRSAPPVCKPADLALQNALVFAGTHTSSAWPFMVNGEAVDMVVHGRFRVDNSLMLREVLRGGLGVALTPHFVVDDLLASGELLGLLPDCMPPPLVVHAVTTQRRQPLPRSQVFFDFLVRKLGGCDYGFG